MRRSATHIARAFTTANTCRRIALSHAWCPTRGRSPSSPSSLPAPVWGKLASIGVAPRTVRLPPKAVTPRLRPAMACRRSSSVPSCGNTSTSVRNGWCPAHGSTTSIAFFAIRDAAKSRPGYANRCIRAIQLRRSHRPHGAAVPLGLKRSPRQFRMQTLGLSRRGKSLTGFFPLSPLEI